MPTPITHLCFALLCGECDLVDDLMFRQEGTPQTHQSVFQISRSFGIRQSSAGRIIPSSFHSHPPREEQRAYSLADALSDSVATRLK